MSEHMKKPDENNDKSPMSKLEKKKQEKKELESSVAKNEARVKELEDKVQAFLNKKNEENAEEKAEISEKAPEPEKNLNPEVMLRGEKLEVGKNLGNNFIIGDIDIYTDPKNPKITLKLNPGQQGMIGTDKKWLVLSMQDMEEITNGKGKIDYEKRVIDWYQKKNTPTAPTLEKTSLNPLDNIEFKGIKLSELTGKQLARHHLVVKSISPDGKNITFTTSDGMQNMGVPPEFTSSLEQLENATNASGLFSTENAIRDWYNQKIKNAPDTSDDTIHETSIETHLNDLEQARNNTREAYLAAYKAKYANNFSAGNLFREAIAKTGFFRKDRAELDEKSELGKARKAYYQAQEVYLAEARTKIENLAGGDNHLKERMQNKFTSLQKLAEQEKAINQGKREAFDSKLRQRAEKMKKQWDSLPQWKKTMITSAVVGGAFAAGGALVAGGGALTIAAGTGWTTMRSVMNTAITKKFGAGAGLAARAATGSVFGIVGGFAARGLTAGAEKIFKKNTEKAIQELETQYNNGTLSYREYIEGKEKIERRDQRWNTSKGAATFAGATVAGVASNLEAVQDAKEHVGGMLGNHHESADENSGGIFNKLKFWGKNDAETPKQTDDVPVNNLDDMTSNTEINLDGDTDRNGETAEIDFGEEVPTQPEMHDVSDLAYVQKGDGVTHIFQRQLEANDDLLAKAESELGMKYEGNEGTFLAALAQKLGYINEDGSSEVRLKLDSDHAYELDTQNGSLVVREYENGSLGETHHMGSNFEGQQNIEVSREYIYGSESHHTGDAKTAEIDFGGNADGNGETAEIDFGESRDNITETAEIDFGENANDGNIDEAEINLDIEKSENLPDEKLSPDEILNTKEGTPESRVVDTREKYFTLKNNGWKLEDGRMIWYERDIAPMSAKEVFKHVGLYNQGSFDIRDKQLAALVPYMNDVYQKIEAQNIDWESWPDNITFDQAALIAEGYSPDAIIPTTPDVVSDVLAYDYGKVADIVQSAETLTPNQATASLAYMKNVFGDYRFDEIMKVPFGNLQTTINQDPMFANGPQQIMQQVVEKIQRSAGVDVTPETSVGEILNRSLVAMGSNTRVENLVAQNN